MYFEAAARQASRSVKPSTLGRIGLAGMTFLFPGSTSGSTTLSSRLDHVEVSPTVVTISPPRPAAFAFPNGVRSHASITYSQPAGYRPLTLDLYLPPESLRPAPDGFPLVMFVHGGAWMGGDPRKLGAIRDFPALLADLAARGYVVAAVSYRLSGEARFPAPAIDVRAALEWLRNQPQFGIDAARTVIWGASAGGQLAALTATSCARPEFGAEATVPAGNASRSTRSSGACVQGVVTWYGVFNFATIAAQAQGSSIQGTAPHDAANAPEWRMLGCVQTECGERLALASPVAHVTRQSPPMLLITGAADRTVPPEQSIEMAARLREAGVPNELLLIPGVDHSLLGPTAEATREATMRALEASFRFIDRTIGPGSRP